MELSQEIDESRHIRTRFQSSRQHGLEHGLKHITPTHNPTPTYQIMVKALGHPAMPYLVLRSTLGEGVVF